LALLVSCASAYIASTPRPDRPSPEPVAFLPGGPDRPNLVLPFLLEPKRTATVTLAHTLVGDAPVDENGRFGLLTIGPDGERVGALTAGEDDQPEARSVGVWEASTGKRLCELAYEAADGTPVLAAFHPSTSRVLVLFTGAKSTEKGWVLVDFDLDRGTP